MKASFFALIFVAWANSSTQGALSYLTQSGQSAASASYFGTGSTSDIDLVSNVPDGSFVLTSTASVGTPPRFFASGIGIVNVVQESRLFSVSVGGGGNGSFPDAGFGGGSGTYNLVFAIQSYTPAQLVLNAGGGSISLTSDSGFSYIFSGRTVNLSQEYQLDRGTYTLAISGSGGIGRGLNGESFSGSAPMGFSLTIIPTPATAGVFALGLLTAGHRRR